MKRIKKLFIKIHSWEPLGDFLNVLHVRSFLGSIYRRLVSQKGEIVTVSYKLPDEHIELLNGAYSEKMMGGQFISFDPLMSEKKFFDAFFSFLRSNDIFYDIGANVGLYTLPMAKKAAQVISIEPEPEIFNRLEANVKHNNLTNVRCFNSALGNFTGESTLSLKTFRVGDEGEKIEVIKGDDLIKRYGLPKPTAVKIDVEGAELKVLKGMRGSLSDCKLLCCEIHSPKVLQGTVEDIVSFLNSCGFSEIEMNPYKDKYNLIARKG